MLVIKCDICKKNIKELNQEITVAIGWERLSFCFGCGKPLLALLKKQKVLLPRLNRQEQRIASQAD